MLIKKLTAVCAAAAALGIVGVSAAAEDIGTAGVYFADEDWLVQYWGGDADDDGNTSVKSVENVVITGNGEYSVSAELEYPISGMVFAALCTDIESSSCPDGMNVTVDSVEINGNAVEFGINGEPQWKDDGGFMRVNIYNTWSDDPTDCAVAAESFADAETLTVRFTVSGLWEDAPEAVTEAVTEEISAAEDTGLPEETEIPPEKTGVPESDKAETATETGNLPAVALFAVASWAAALALTAYKKE